MNITGIHHKLLSEHIHLDKNINHFRHQLKTYCSLSYLPTVYFNQNEVVIHLSSNYDKSLELSKLSLQFIISYCTNIKKEKDI